MTICDKAMCDWIGAVRDYAFGELPAADRAGVERHVAGCAECAAEFDGFRLTVASLRALPDVEIPQRIAFVSDKVFEASGWSRFWAGFWNSSARLGFASAVLVAVAAIAVSSRPVAVAPLVAQVKAPVANTPVDLDGAVAKAVAQARAEDNAQFQTILASVEARHKKEHQELLVAVQENLDVMQKRMGAYTSLASLDVPRENGGQ